MFFSGSLQEGITTALQEAKAVVCFVKDDSQTSSTWEEEYFTGAEFPQLLEAKAILLRIIKDSPEATFLASVCPISQYPTIVVIRSGMLREYIVPEISKEDFRRRLTAVLDDSSPQTTQPAAPAAPTQSAPQSRSTESSSSPSTQPANITPVSGGDTTAHPPVTQDQSKQSQGSSASSVKKKNGEEGTSQSSHVSSKSDMRKPKDALQPTKSDIQASSSSMKGNRKLSSTVPVAGSSTSESSKTSTTSTPGPPSQYRLQVRLFDGRSVRSTFRPLQTIRGDVRPWLDSQMTEEKHPFNLKHILAPLPNRTLTIAEEEQTLRELISGSTATFVMVPIQTYTEAYSSIGSSLPVRAASGVYGIISSAVGMATGLVGSFLGYNQTTSPSTAETSSSSTNVPSQPLGGAGRRRPDIGSNGSNIRTLRDQRDGQDRKEFYNGNQLNFEPRRDNDE